MNNPNITPELLAELRQRYRPVDVPKCRVCGAEMTIARMSCFKTLYACSGATYDDTGCHYAPGRSLADDHYANSQQTVVDIGDNDVLAMVDELERLQRERETLRPVGVLSVDRFHALERGDSRFVALWPRPGLSSPRKRPDDGVIVYAFTEKEA